MQIQRWGMQVCVLLFACTFLGQQFDNQHTIRQKLLEQVGATQRIAVDRLEIGDFHMRHYSLTIGPAYVAKVFDRATGDAWLAGVDSAGDPIEVSAADRREQQARTAKYGKLDPALYDLLQKMQTAAPLDAFSASMVQAGTVPVSIWIKANPTLVRNSNLGSHLDQLEQYMGTVRARMLQALRGMGVQPDTPKYGPALFARLTPGQIRAIEAHPDVLTVYGPAQYRLFEDDASTTQRNYRVWAAGNLGFSTSSRPVVHEPDGVSDFNPLLNNASHPVVFWCSSTSSACPSGKNITSLGDHASEVAGCFGATDPLVRGVSPSAPLILSANTQDFTDAKTVAGFEWARGNGGDPTNMSWGTTCGGTQTFFSRYVDFAVRSVFATFVISAGNNGTDTTTCGEVSAPGLAWNAITVGSQFDSNNGFWSDDGMSSFSSWKDPSSFTPSPSKPEVVAVGQDVRTTNSSGLTSGGVNGTSFAAPQVAGQVTLMLARQPGQNQWPETNKAAVLASAYHDVDTTGTSKDGVGSVVMNNSDDTYRLGRFFNDCGSGCIPLQASDFDRNFTASLTAGARYRVALAYDSDSNGSSSDVLGADIDLDIFKPDGTLLTGSFSSNNTWEMAEFTAPVSGVYTFRAHLFSSESGWPGTFLGVAYSQKVVPNFCTGVGTGAGTFSINTANGPTYFDSYSGWGFDQSGREFVRKIVLSTAKNINVSDTNSNLDLHLIKISSCKADPIVPTVVANGSNSISVSSAPAGTYYVVVDGRAGAVGTDTLTIAVGP